MSANQSRTSKNESPRECCVLQGASETQIDEECWFAFRVVRDGDRHVVIASPTVEEPDDRRLLDAPPSRPELLYGIPSCDLKPVRTLRGKEVGVADNRRESPDSAAVRLDGSASGRIDLKIDHVGVPFDHRIEFVLLISRARPAEDSDR